MIRIKAPRLASKVHLESLRRPRGKQIPGKGILRTLEEPHLWCKKNEIESKKWKVCFRQEYLLARGAEIPKCLVSAEYHIIIALPLSSNWVHFIPILLDRMPEKVSTARASSYYDSNMPTNVLSSTRMDGNRFGTWWQFMKKWLRTLNSYAEIVMSFLCQFTRHYWPYLFTHFNSFDKLLLHLEEALSLPLSPSLSLFLLSSIHHFAASFIHSSGTTSIDAHSEHRFICIQQHESEWITVFASVQ